MTKETGKQEIIEEMQGIAPQKRFDTLDAFVKGQNNFYAHFTVGTLFAESKRVKSHFQRFKMMYPEMEMELSLKVCGPARECPLEVQEKLFRAYQLMSQLVFECDKGVQRYTHKDHYLIS